MEQSNHVFSLSISLAHDHAKENKHKVEVELGIYIDGTKPSSKLAAFGMVEEGYEGDALHELNAEVKE